MKSLMISSAVCITSCKLRVTTYDKPEWLKTIELYSLTGCQKSVLSRTTLSLLAFTAVSNLGILYLWLHN